MADRDRDSLSLRWAGWPAALILFGVALGLELLPYIGGTGENLRFDWAWTYVTLHFILLPLACGVHIMVNLYRFAVLFRSQRSGAMRAAFSLVIPVGYLLLLYVNPVLPLWGSLTFEDLAGEMGVRVGE
jgi:hypothetical protein